MRIVASPQPQAQKAKPAGSVTRGREFSGNSREAGLGLDPRRSSGPGTGERPPPAGVDDQGGESPGIARSRPAHDFGRISIHAGVRPSLPIRPKLRVGAPGDRYEEEADRVAEQVLRMPERQPPPGGSPTSHTQPALLPTLSVASPDQAHQRTADGAAEPVMTGYSAPPGAPLLPISRLPLSTATGGAVTIAPPIVEQVLDAPGEPLDARTRAVLEPRFGHDFARVRVHADARAGMAASAIGARAFTMGENIVFDAGEYAPHTQAGRKLLAHELTHVVQQQAHARAGGGTAAGTHESHAGGTWPMRQAALPLQRQPNPAKAQTQGSIGGPKNDWHFKSFQMMLEKQQLLEKLNGPVARRIAKEYVNRSELKSTKEKLQATPYSADRVQPGVRVDPSEKDVASALIGALEMKKLGRGNNAADWMWVPVPEKTIGAQDTKKPGKGSNTAEWTWVPTAEKTGRDDAVVETGKAVVQEFLGGDDLSEIYTSQAKDIAFELTTVWLEKQGMKAIAEIATGVSAVIGYFALAISVLELLVLLTKPEKPRMSKDEMIVADVKLWLARDQIAAKAAAEGAAEQRSREEFYGVESNPWAPVSTRVGR